MDKKGKDENTSEKENPKPGSELIKAFNLDFKLDVSFKPDEPFENCFNKIGFGKNHD